MPLNRRDSMGRMSVDSLFRFIFPPLSVRTVILVLVLCVTTEANQEWPENEAVIVNTSEASPGSGSDIWNGE